MKGLGNRSFPLEAVGKVQQVLIFLARGFLMTALVLAKRLIVAVKKIDGS